MNASCIWMRHAYQRVARINQSHVLMSHAYQWVTHMNESHWWMRHVSYHTYQWVTHINQSHVWISHTYECVTHMNASHIPMRRTYQCVAHTNAWHIPMRDTYQCVTHTNVSHIWMRDVMLQGVGQRVSTRETIKVDATRAEELLRRALQILPDHPPALTHLAYVLEYHAKQYDEAERYCNTLQHAAARCSTEHVTQMKQSPVLTYGSRDTNETVTCIDIWVTWHMHKSRLACDEARHHMMKLVVICQTWRWWWSSSSYARHDAMKLVIMCAKHDANDDMTLWSKTWRYEAKHDANDDMTLSSLSECGTHINEWHMNRSRDICASEESHE